MPDAPEPVISIGLESDRAEYSPADFLSGEFWIRVPADSSIRAMEYSVIWITSGKGEEDIGVHFFQRRNRSALVGDALSQPQRFSTVLPSSPLTYQGTLLKIHWCVRVRLFLEDGQEIIQDREFTLGNARSRSANVAMPETEPQR